MNKSELREWSLQALQLNPDKYPELPLDVKNDLINNGEKYLFSHDGYECKILSGNKFSGRIGLVKLPKNHQDYGKTLFHPDLQTIKIHDGLTYYNEEGWYGFNCNGKLDICPYHYILRNKDPEIQNRFDGNHTYWSFPLVKAEVIKLVEQFKARNNRSKDLMQ